jgi:hypothetical protein
MAIAHLTLWVRRAKNDENDNLRNKNLRKSIIDNKNTEKRIFVRMFFILCFQEKGGGRWEKRGGAGESTPMSTPSFIDYNSIKEVI